MAKLQRMLATHAQSLGWTVRQDAFTASTPNGQVAMRNIIASRKGSVGKRAIVITGHYDTKVMRGMNFVGANDGGSSAGTLMELAKALAHAPIKDDLYLVWLDGEEAVVSWTDTDSLYGSRHLADLWYREGMLGRIRALINVDMTGDRDLQLVDEMGSTEWLRRLVWSTGLGLGERRAFSGPANIIGDDHLPFIERGVSSLDLIDFDYGPNNSYWHTDQDTVDKLDARSFQTIGNVILAVIPKLEERGDR